MAGAGSLQAMLFLTLSSSLASAGWQLVLLLAEQYIYIFTSTISRLFLAFSLWLLAVDAFKGLEQVVCFVCPEEEERCMGQAKPGRLPRPGGGSTHL